MRHCHEEEEKAAGGRGEEGELLTQHLHYSHHFIVTSDTNIYGRRTLRTQLWGRINLTRILISYTEVKILIDVRYVRY